MRKFSEFDNGKNKKSWTKLIISLLIVSLIGGLSVGAGIQLVDYYLIDDSTEATRNLETVETQNVNYHEFSMEENKIADVVDQTRNSVVAITNRVKYRDWFNNTKVQEGSGSGVVISQDNQFYYIATNNHVIQESSELLIGIGENTINAEIVGNDPYSDLAVVKIRKEDVNFDIQPIDIGDSDALRQGDTAIAIGNPLGYNHTVTVGVISALNRQIEINDNIPLIQTDAAINPGNSGGALVNGNGELIAINTAKIATTQVEGMGFAIPINTAKPIIKQLIENGSVARPYLGITGKTVDEELSDLYELPLGVVVAQVAPESGAADAGLAQGDVIIKLNEQRINSIEQLSEEINKRDVGDIVELTIVRNGDEKIVKEVELKNRNE